MARLALVALGFVALVAFAGCSQPSDTPAPSTAPYDDSADGLSFGPTVIVDDMRIASEPQIKSASDGSLFICAPTGNVKYATRPLDLPAEANKGAYQSAIWSSRDAGVTWEFSQMAVPYHSALPGGGDCALGTDAAGTLYMTDQLGLASEVMSISKDNGKTWEAASAIASGYPAVDRQWVTADPTTAGTVYLVYNNQAVGLTVSKSTDSGSTWAAVPVAAAQDMEGNPPGPIVATNQTVAFSAYLNGDIHFYHSEDQGASWTIDNIAPEHGQIADLFPATMADTKGNLYVAWVESAGEGSNIAYVTSSDAGKTWSPAHIAFHEQGTALFMWGTAGSDGRLGFSWYLAGTSEGPYHEQAGIVLDARSASPQTWETRVSPIAAREDAICTGGTSCTSGRELGDFQTCAIGPDGMLMVSFVIVNGTNTAGQPNGGHIAYSKLATGPSLFENGDAWKPWVV